VGRTCSTRGDNFTFPPAAQQARVLPVSNAPRETLTARRLTELRRAHPADATLQNLLTALGSKLELCTRLPVYEYEAASEGHEDCARAFEVLAHAERAHVTELMKLLRSHVDHSLMREEAGS
jgi:rubrerythrin